MSNTKNRPRPIPRFCKLSTPVAHYYTDLGLKTPSPKDLGLVYGFIDFYASGKDRICRARRKTYAENVFSSRTVISRCVSRLVEDGFIMDVSPVDNSGPRHLKPTEKVLEVGDPCHYFHKGEVPESNGRVVHG